MAAVAGDTFSLPNPSDSNRDSSQSGEIVVLDSGIAPGINYRMRAFDQNGSVNDYVYWDSPVIDAFGTDYTGSAGPIVDIVVFDIRGT